MLIYLPLMGWMQVRYKPTYERLTCTLSVGGININSYDRVVMESSHGVFNESESNNGCTMQISWNVFFVVLANYSKRFCPKDRGSYNHHRWI